jgi:hypothetical protein
MNVQTNASVERSISSETGQKVSQPRAAATAAQVIVVSAYGLLVLAVLTGYGAAFAPLVTQI